MHSCLNLNALVTTFASSSLAIYFLCGFSVTMLVLRERFFVLQFMTFCCFRSFWITYMLSKLSCSFTVLLSRSQFFSDQKTNLPAHSWRSQIVPDHLYLDEIELIQALLPNKYDKSCRSFRDGVGPCNQRFGNRNVCHGLSSDLSFVLSSICLSRDLMLEIHP